MHIAFIKMVSMIFRDHNCEHSYFMERAGMPRSVGDSSAAWARDQAGT